MSTPYRVDLSDLAMPSAALSVTHRNPTLGDEPCRHAPYDTGEYAHMIARCYWNYLRIYTLEEAQLTGATPYEIPSEWMIRAKSIPARVDELDNEGLIDENVAGLRAWGTMLVGQLAWT